MWWLARILVFASVVIGCTNETGPDPIGIVDSISLAMESVIAEVGAACNATETGAVFPSAACDYATKRQCSTQYGSVRWGECSVGQLTLQGGWNERFSSDPCCTSFSSTCVVDRDTASYAVVLPGGSKISISSDAHTSWDGVSIPGGVHVQPDSGNRAITFYGLQRTFYSANMVQIFNHSLRTTSQLQVFGNLQSQTRRIDSGTMVVHHNRVKYNITTEFDATDKVTWENSNCCYPTKGKISGTLSGALSGTVSMEFTSTCGQATFTDQNNNQSTITLTQCL